MSARKEKTRNAIAKKLKADADLSAIIEGRVHHMGSPDPAVYPLVILDDFKPSESYKTWGGQKVAETFDWRVVAQVAKSTDPTKGAIQQAEEILDLAETAIGGELELVGATTLVVERLRDLKSERGIVGGQTIQFRGFVLRTIVS
jgi:hypothetical protein